MREPYSPPLSSAEGKKQTDGPLARPGGREAKPKRTPIGPYLLRLISISFWNRRARAGERVGPLDRAKVRLPFAALPRGEWARIARRVSAVFPRDSAASERVLLASERPDDLLELLPLGFAPLTFPLVPLLPRGLLYLASRQRIVAGFGRYALPER